MKLAIVTTVRRWDRSMDQWLSYHRAIGFERLYVFCDQPSAGPAPAPGELRLIQCDTAHWQRFGGHPLAIKLDAARRMNGPDWREPEFLMLRQALNAELALFFANQEKIAWLLHIDGDELFDPGRHALAAHFSRLDADGVEQARYLNKEAVVWGEGADDFFSELTLFKVNPKLLSPAQWDVVRRVMGEQPYFLAYANGKSAIRVSAEVHASGVHGFRTRDGGRERSVFSEPAILHYPYADYARFRVRHEAAGAEAAGIVLGPAWRPPALFAIAKLPPVPGRPEAMRPIFDRWVALNDATSRQALIDADVIEVVERPARILKQN
ncbi:MAG TPA: glycosyltransferase family 2 protein [Dongiaceae bacterium]|jgi:hypothetical protein|nr:glycosyltransferase family 2 protein [Dongiaceae bacterium]